MLNELLKSIPKGKVAIYGHVALLAGNPRRARVVGYTLYVNPEGRVAPDFAFGGEGIQRQLLESKGIVFESDSRENLRKYSI